MNEAVCTDVRTNIKEEINNFLIRKKIQIVIGKLYKDREKVHISPEILWGEKSKNLTSSNILLPNQMRYIDFEAKRSFEKGCPPDYSVNVGDRIVLVNSDIESNEIDLSKIKFYTLDRKNLLNNPQQSRMAYVEIDEKELVRQLDSAFGARVE